MPNEFQGFEDPNKPAFKDENLKAKVDEFMAKVSAPVPNPAKDQTGEDSSSDIAKRETTFGEKLVGLTFNPSNDDKVAKAKKLCADLMDLVNECCDNREATKIEHYLYSHTIGEILNAQMNVVKLLTLKY